MFRPLPWSWLSGPRRSRAVGVAAADGQAIEDRGVVHVQSDDDVVGVVGGVREVRPVVGVQVALRMVTRVAQSR